MVLLKMASLSMLRYRFAQGKHRNPTAVRDRYFRAAESVSFPSLASLENSSSACLGDHLLNFAVAGGGGGYGGVGYGGGGGGGGGGDGGSFSDGHNDKNSWGPLGLFLKGWRSRVEADPQFPFKVLMEELVGVSSNVLGDMASRPNFGLNELDFVFSTLVVGCIVNFVLMYILAPTASSSALSSSLPGIFANCPQSHMFESGAYGFSHRFGTFVYKGLLFAAVGFAAGLAGTALSNGLIKMRKRMDPDFETPNKPPPTVLNAVTWAIHMGLNANLRYQSVNGLEFVLEKALPSLAFKSSVVALRCFNNVLGGMTFVMLARLTGSQSVEERKSDRLEMRSLEVEEKLVNEDTASVSK